MGKKWADLMATSGQVYWPSVGNSVAADGQFFMAADRGSITLDIYGRVLAGRRSEGTEIMSSAMKQSLCAFPAVGTTVA